MDIIEGKNIHEIEKKAKELQEYVEKNLKRHNVPVLVKNFGADKKNSKIVIEDFVNKKLRLIFDCE
jgi:hypothetical protein